VQGQFFQKAPLPAGGKVLENKMKLPRFLRMQKHIPVIMLLLAPLLFLLDIVLIPLVVIGALVFYLIRYIDINHLEKMPVTKRILRFIGVYPVMHHFYDPLVHPGDLRLSLDEERALPGLDLNIDEQLKILGSFQCSHEFEKFSYNPGKTLTYFYFNYSFLPVDAQYLYSMIRTFKPKRMIEIGSGFSTLMAADAFKENRQENRDYHYEHICIEPYRHSWLGDLKVTLIKQRVEELAEDIFQQLDANDILFIDSSHVIKPQGDILFLYLHTLPLLKPGVIVHIHDIYTPANYPYKCLVKQMKFWNEQYVLEAFLSFNNRFEIIGALNFLKGHYFKELAAVCPALTDERILQQAGKKLRGSSLHFLETSSFWIRPRDAGGL
jgi:predicted O-methyltransferase YrrM